MVPSLWNGYYTWSSECCTSRQRNTYRCQKNASDRDLADLVKALATLCDSPSPCCGRYSPFTSFLERVFAMKGRHGKGTVSRAGRRERKATREEEQRGCKRVERQRGASREKEAERFPNETEPGKERRGQGTDAGLANSAAQTCF